MEDRKARNYGDDVEAATAAFELNQNIHTAARLLAAQRRADAQEKSNVQ